MDSKYTNEQIASDETLWNEYVDPQGNEPEAFDQLTFDERVAAIIEMFPAG